MAPQLASTTVQNLIQSQESTCNEEQTKMTVERIKLDCNRNHEKVVAVVKQEVQQPRRTLNPGDVNERSRRLVRSCLGHLNTNLNVLVIGAGGSGKSSLINSMNMALQQEWRDRAKYCPGRNHVIDECVMFHNRKLGGKVVFWDARGFETVHEDAHAVLILRYVLEGRIPSKCIPCVLLMDVDTIKKRYHRVADPHRRIDLVLYVSDYTEAPQTRLMDLVERAISSSKQVCVNDVPVVSVLTKSDLAVKTMSQPSATHRRHLNEYSIEHLRCERQRHGSGSKKHRGGGGDEISPCPPRFVDNYRCELEPWSDETTNPSQVRPCHERDAALLSIWRDIVSRTAACGSGDRRKRAYSSAGHHQHSSALTRCLPFRLDYTRLRSQSF